MRKAVCCGRQMMHCVMESADNKLWLNRGQIYVPRVYFWTIVFDFHGKKYASIVCLSEWSIKSRCEGSQCICKYLSLKDGDMRRWTGHVCARPIYFEVPKRHYVAVRVLMEDCRWTILSGKTFQHIGRFCN